ncbi:MAG TPA: helix-turn-helix transcriptional regulator [Kamptonema sp.]|nr:helix-turn-helix transcriptional regulator [Kamptonema sp.]
MKFCEALDRTLEDYGISAKWLSEQSGVSMQMISQYRNGKQRVYSDSLEAMVNALPLEVRRHFYSLMNGDRIPNVSVMSEIELADLMDQIAKTLRKRTDARSPVRI